MIYTALVADDDALSREFLEEALDSLGLDVTAVKDGKEALKTAKKNKNFDLVVTDLRMPGLDGTGLLKELRRNGMEMPVVVVTAYGTVESAVEAMREGADDFLLKPISVEQIEIVLEKLIRHRRLEEENRYLRSRESAESAGGDLVYVSPVMEELVEVARRAANSKATALVTGESGTGKEVISRFIHQSSPRRRHPYVKVNCAALSENLLESELFGHEEGAFTGAISKRKGRFELADKGTLLLDEIGEISPSLQAKLLRVLEEEEFERVGGSRPIEVDVRVIATTNRNLAEEMEAGRFRRDLFYRLNVVPINIPSLRERREEIPVLAEHFLRIFARDRGKKEMCLSESARDRLLSYEWPGNVRELRNVLQRMAILGSVQVMEAEHIDQIVSLTSGSDSDRDTGVRAAVGKTIEEVEKEMILGTLRVTGGNRKETSRMLGITTRTLSNKIKTYRLMGISVPAKRSVL